MDFLIGLCAMSNLKTGFLIFIVLAFLVLVIGIIYSVIRWLLTTPSTEIWQGIKDVLLTLVCFAGAAFVIYCLLWSIGWIIQKIFCQPFHFLLPLTGRVSPKPAPTQNLYMGRMGKARQARLLVRLQVRFLHCPLQVCAGGYQINPQTEMHNPETMHDAKGDSRRDGRTLTWLEWRRLSQKQ